MCGEWIWLKTKSRMTYMGLITLFQYEQSQICKTDQFYEYFKIHSRNQYHDECLKSIYLICKTEWFKFSSLTFHEGLIQIRLRYCLIFWVFQYLNDVNVLITKCQCPLSETLIYILVYFSRNGKPNINQKIHHAMSCL